jgi:hypothetical protein
LSSWSLPHLVGRPQDTRTNPCCYKGNSAGSSSWGITLNPNLVVWQECNLL